MDADTGMVAVTYPDLDDATTVLIPMMSFYDEYKIPAIGDEVTVLHMGNGPAMAFVLGKYWNKKHKPAKTGTNIYRKEFGHNPGDAYIEYTDGGDITIANPNGDIKFITKSGTISLSSLMSGSTS